MLTPQCGQMPLTEGEARSGGKGMSGSASLGSSGNSSGDGRNVADPRSPGGPPFPDPVGARTQVRDYLHILVAIPIDARPKSISATVRLPRQIHL